MDKLCLVCAATFFFCFASGCSAETNDGIDEDLMGDEPVVKPRAMGGNAMGGNAMGGNAMDANALAPAMLATTALSPYALSSSTMATLTAPTADGTLARQLVKYTVSCALSSVQHFDFRWTGADGVTHDEVYQGLLGIAPAWADMPLTDTTQQRLVSGCLAARVNYYEVPVNISLRSPYAPLRTSPTDLELAEQPYVEGVFWGNLFGTSPYVSACYVPANAAHSRAAKRDCATGHLDGSTLVPCGMIVLAGACDDVCSGFNAGQYYSSCKDHPFGTSSARTDAVITTGLR